MTIIMPNSIATWPGTCYYGTEWGIAKAQSDIFVHEVDVPEMQEFRVGDVLSGVTVAVAIYSVKSVV